MNEESRRRLIDYCLGLMEGMPRYSGMGREEKLAVILPIVDNEYLDLRNDWAMKYVFSHKSLLLMLINDILGTAFSDLEYRPNENLKLRREDKTVIYDVICRTASGEMVAVEVQKTERFDQKDRLVYYAAQLIRSEKRSGSGNYFIAPVYVICIMDYATPHIPETSPEQLLFKYRLREDTTGELYGNQQTICLMELPRCQLATAHLDNPVAEWFHIFKSLTNFALESRDAGGRFAELMDVARVSGLDERQIKQYLTDMISDEERYSIALAGEKRGFEKGITEGVAKGREEGRAEGLEEGREQNRLDTAKKMLALGIAPEVIVKVTGLTLDENGNFKG